MADTAPDPGGRPAIRRSAETMARAAAFLGTGDIGPAGASVLANTLRELDRFLSVLIDEVAPAALPAGFDRARFASRRNTPNKLRRIHDALGLASPDQERLRTIGRQRERLFHAARSARLDAGLPGQAALAADLRGIGALYGRIAEELVCASAALRPIH